MLPLGMLERSFRSSTNTRDPDHFFAEASSQYYGWVERLLNRSPSRSAFSKLLLICDGSKGRLPVAIPNVNAICQMAWPGGIQSQQPMVLPERWSYLRGLAFLLLKLWKTNLRRIYCGVHPRHRSNGLRAGIGLVMISCFCVD